MNEKGPNCKVRIEANPARKSRLTPDRLEEILTIAMKVFLARGFDGASTAEIAQESNASKATFYSRFRTKEKLFHAVIEKRLTEIFSDVVQFPADCSLQENLKSFGIRLLRRAMSSEQIALIRLVNGESLKHPELAQTFYRLGPERAERSLAAYFESCRKAESLSKGDCMMMAQHFMALLTSGHARWFVLQFDGKQLTEPALRHHVNGAVEVFLRAYRER